MKEWAGDNLNWKFALLLCVGVIAFYYFLFLSRAKVDVVIEVEQKAWFKIYWSADNNPFAEKQLGRVRLKPGRTNYSFYLTDLRKIDTLRIDTHDYEGKAILHSLSISQKGFKRIEINSVNALSQLNPLFQIASAGIENNALVVTSAGIDPNFLFDLHNIEEEDFGLLEEIVRAAALGVFILLLYSGAGWLAADYKFVPLCLTIVLALAAVMAVISKNNAHPDEFVHVAAVEYYQNNWFPPEIGDESILGSYSPYGVSRLHGKEIYYLIAGKISKIVSPFYFNNYLPCRTFNVLLLMSILLYTTKVAGSRIMAIPLLISPQVWYLFGYCNSDAFALTITFFVSCQILLPNSMFNRYISEVIRGGLLLRGCAAGLMIGILFLLKNNFLPFTAFLFFILFLIFMRLPGREARLSFLTRLAILLVVGLSLTGVKKYADYRINGPDRDVLIKAAKAQFADVIHNPESKLEQKHTNLYLKERGIPLKTVVTEYRWFEKTFRSAFGVYGYMEFSGTNTFYDIVRWSAVAFLLFFFGTICIRGDATGMLSGGAALCLAIALIGASLHHSWVADFQPQGRYLFPILGMLMILCGQNRHVFSVRWMSLLGVWMFSLSFYSFVIFGLREIARTAIV